MRALLDVNVLIALLDSDHASHDSTINWFAKHAREGWASCPITQNGCIRVMSNPGYPNPLAVQAVIEHLADACHQKIHEFWPDDLTLFDSRRVRRDRLLNSAQVTDTYLLALAGAHGGKLATFDQNLVTDAVVNGSQYLQLIG